MAVAVQFLGHLQVRRMIQRCGPQDELTTEGQSLWRGMGAYHRLQTGLFGVSQGHLGSERNGHGGVPYDTERIAKHDVTVPSFYTLSTPQCTGVGFMKWTSRLGREASAGEICVKPG